MQSDAVSAIKALLLLLLNYRVAYCYFTTSAYYYFTTLLQDMQSDALFASMALAPQRSVLALLVQKYKY